ncbi:MAG: ATP-binding cassette domain-containing protein [Clostridia bacterium]|nr:ATP-binding cassette domain-containing protein [Clostridia bacterium]
MLELRDLHWTTPDGTEIIKGVSLCAVRGKLTVITGPNGGGKTSIAKLIAGLSIPTKGNIILDGQDVTNKDITERALAGIAYAFQQPVRFKGITVRQLLELAAKRELKDGEICEILGKVGLCTKEYLNRTIDASLSGGESKRIELASVLARKDVKVTVFDEPEAGIDLWSFTSLIEAFKDLKAERDGALLVISHQERILEIADEIVVIADGKVRVAGSREEVLPMLMNNEKQRSCPLGKREA